MKIVLPLRQPKKLVLTRIIETILVAIFSVLMIKAGIFPPMFRYIMLVIITMYVFAVIPLRGWTKRDLGFRNDTLKHWRPYLGCTIIAVGVVIIFHYLFALPPPAWSRSQIVVLAIVSLFLSLVQEFLYRSFLFRLFYDISRNEWGIIAVNAVLFGFMHIIFPNLLAILPLTVMGGFLFAILYSRYPNYWLVSMSHFATNLTALVLNFFPLDLFSFLFAWISQ